MTIGGKNPISTFLFFLAASHLPLLDNPEVGPGGTVGFPGSFTTTPTGGSPQATTATSSLRPATPPSGSSKSNAGVIAGSVISGIAIISVTVLMALYLRQRQRPNAPSATLELDETLQPQSEAEKVPSDDGTRASPSIHDTSIPPRAFYACVFMSSFHL